MTPRLVTQLSLFTADRTRCHASIGYAQEATLTGTITDSTGGVLPGVTVTAVHEATGNRFVAVTDERGIYRIPARVGAYQLTAELAGFTRSHDRASSCWSARPRPSTCRWRRRRSRKRSPSRRRRRCSTSTTSSLGGNIDPAAGAGAAGAGTQLDGAGDAGARQPDDVGRRRRRRCRIATAASSASSSSTLDGQQVSSERGFGGQPRYSQESIAEFQFISNRFDATHGPFVRRAGDARSPRSGTNTFSGSVRGNFRDSRFNAENPVLNRVVPIDNQQIAFTLGGPILRDRLHFFGHFEYEREPRISIWNTPYPAFNVELEGNADGQDGRRAARLPAVAEHAADGQGLGRRAVAAVRRRQQQSSGRDRVAGRRSTASTSVSSRRCSAIAPSTRSRSGITKYFFDQVEPHHVVESLAGRHRSARIRRA